MLDINTLGQVAHVHTAALEVIDAVVGSEAVGGGDSLHASDNGLIGFLARVDIDAVAFGIVVVLKEREGEERVRRIVVAQVVERRALHIDAAHAFYQAVARRHLTSSLRHPKILIKEFSYFLMPCHQHGLRINLLV